MPDFPEMPSHAFIFDMDGVLVDSNPAHTIALKQFCKQHGYDLMEDQLREKIYGRTNTDWIRNLFGNIDPDLIRQYGDEKEVLYRELYKNDIKPLAGLIPFLEIITREKFPCAIATSAQRKNVDFTLSKTGMDRFFTTVLDESYVTRGKPDPEIYLKSAAALKFSPNQCIVFEDSLSGIRAGKAAGCKVVGVATTHTHAELHEADHVIDDFNGLDPKKLISILF